MTDHDDSGQPETIAEEKDEALKPSWTYEEIKGTWNRVSDFWREFHEETRALAKFAAGEQWEHKAKPGEIQITMNMIPMFVRSVSNAARKNPPSIKIIPGDSQASEQVATILDGLVEHVERKSLAPRVYTDALELAAEQQIGGWRITIEQTDEGRYEPRLRSIRDVCECFPDPGAKEPGLRDAQYFFILDTMQKDAFKREWPEAEVCDFGGDKLSFDGDSDTVRIAEFWFKDAARDGRWSQWFLSGDEILEQNDDYPGTKCPLCLVTARERHVDGKRRFECITRDIKDQQKKLNYTETIAALAMSNPIQAKVLATAKQIGAYQPIWDNATKEQRVYLPVDDASEGMPVPLQQSPFPAELLQISTMATEEMRQVLGMRDPVKDLPASQSGKAIALQLSQTDVATYGYHFALQMALQHTGDALLELIPEYFNYAHTRNFQRPGGEIQQAKIAMQYNDGGRLAYNDLKQGCFECIVSTGPTYENRKQEVSEALSQLFQANPQWMGVLGDIWVSFLDFDGAKDAAARIRATMDPKILAATAGDSPESRAAMAQSENAQLHQMIDQLTQALQQTTAQRDELANGANLKLQMQQAEHAHRERLAQMQIGSAQTIATNGNENRIDLELLKLDGASKIQTEKTTDQAHLMALEGNLQVATGTDIGKH